jgi:putative ABC transport system permease protein
MGSLSNALRGLLRSPGFALIAVAALALGIGANAAIFSVINAIFLRPLPYVAPEQLMQMVSVDAQQQQDNLGVSWPRIEAIRERQEVFSSLGVSIGTAFTVTGGETPEQVNGMQVSHDFFPTLGVAPSLGRTFIADEDRAGGAPVALISHDYWQRAYGARADILGQTLMLDGRAHTVIGVMPKRLSAFPMNQVQVWTARPKEVSFLVPVQIDGGGFFFNLIGRLKPGVSEAQAREAVRRIAAAQAQASPTHADAKASADIKPMLQALVGNQRQTFTLLFGAVSCLLLLAAANVANLVLTRHISRRKQLAIRFALGARRRHVLAELVCENLMLAVLGATLGLLLAWWGLQLLKAANIANVPRLDEIAVDGTVVAFTLGIALLTGLVLGLIPGLQLREAALGNALHDANRESTSGRGQNRMRSGLLVGEVALSFLMLVGASLLVTTAIQLQRVDPGFRAQGVLTALIQVPQTQYPDGSVALANFYSALQSRLASIPGVQSAAIGDTLPLSGFNGPAPYAVLGRPIPPMAEQQNGLRHIVSAGYFNTLGVPLLRGRDFNERDTPNTPAAIIINETMARKEFPDGDPIGQRVVTGMGQREAEIVGVVADTRTLDLTQAPVAEFYHPTAQRPENFVFLLVRTSGEPTALTESVRRALKETDPTIALTNVATLEDVVAQNSADRRMTTNLLSGFAVLALLLASFGVYAVMAYSVSQRKAEFGIRLALGAQPVAVRRMVLRQGMMLTAWGLALGLAAALAGAYLIRSLLYGIDPSNPLTYAAVGALLLVVAALASWLPARRAARVPAIAVLRS